MIEAGWIEIEEAKHLPMNAKLHDLADLELSFDDFGFVDRVIVNRTTGNLISGHGRLDALVNMKEAKKAAPGNVKVEGGRWFAPVDYIECDAEREDALAVRLNLSRMKGGNVDRGAMLGSIDLEKLYQTAADAAAKGYLEATGLTDAAMKYLENKPPEDNEWEGAFERLPDEDRAPFQQMTFTVHDDQAEIIKEALTLAKHAGDFTDSPNENSNGNALAYICEVFASLPNYGNG